MSVPTHEADVGTSKLARQAIIQCFRFHPRSTGLQAVHVLLQFCCYVFCCNGQLGKACLQNAMQHPHKFKHNRCITTNICLTNSAA